MTSHAGVRGGQAGAQAFTMLECDERMCGWAAVGERGGPSEQSDTSMAVCSQSRID